MNLGRLVSLLTSPSLAVAACPGVCGCAWVVRSSVCVYCVPGSVPPSASAFTVSVPVPVLNLSAPPSLWLWVWLGHPLLYLCLLCAWVCSSICVCICCMSVLVPGWSAPLSASIVSLALPKAFKMELINVAFLDSLGNHVQFASSFCSIARSITRSIARSITRSIAHPIALPRICGFYRSLYRAPGLGARISGVKYRKSYDNIPSQDNLDTRTAIYIIWRCLALGLRHWEHSDARCLRRKLGCSENQIAWCLSKVCRRNLQYAQEKCRTPGLEQEKCKKIVSCPGRIRKGGKVYHTFPSFFLS